MKYSHGDGENPLAQSYNLKTLPDVVVPDAGPRLVWYHRNSRSVYPVCPEVQHLEALKGKFTDPLLNHTFGASLRGVGMVPDGAKASKSSKAAKRHQLAVCVLAERAESPEAWRQDLEKLERVVLQPGFDQTRLTTAKWWQAFWNRSWVFVEADAGAANRAASEATASKMPLCHHHRRI